MKRAPAVLMISVVITLIGSDLSVGAAPVSPARMASSAGDTFVPQAINRTPTGGPPVGPHPQTQQRTEVVGKRTRTSDSYSLGQLYEAVIYPGSINYQDAAGNWQPIDNTLAPSSRAGYAFTNKANRYAADLPSDLSQAPVRFALGSSWVEFSLVGGSGKGSVSKDTDTFASALPNVSVSFTARNDALKEALSLQNLAAGNSFSYRVQTSTGLSAKAQAAGGISFIDGAGRTQFSFAPPTMFDSASGQTNISRAVTMSLVQGPSGLTVSLVADSTWLSDPARKWPVTIDPTISLTGSDCWLTSGLPNSSYCGSTDIRVGTDGFAYARALVKIQPETVLGKVEVRSASLQLYDFYNSTSNTTPVGLYQVTQSWDNTATWNNATTAQPWTTAGGTIATPAAVTNNTVGGTTGWQYWYPTQLVQSWINGTVPDYGMLLKEPTENVVNVIEFDSATSGNSTLWPHLNVTYDPGLGEQKSFQYDSNGLTDRMDFGVNVGNGNVVLHNHDLSISGTGLDLKVDRYFNNLADTTWDFGSRWTVDLGWDVFLLPQADGTVRYAAPTGFQTVFTPNGSGYTPPPDLDANLIKNADGTYALSFNQSGEQYHFTSGGTLTSDVDKNGNTITFAYDSSSRLSSITDAQGRVTTFSYASPINANFVSLITDPAGRKFQYAYDTNVNLTSYTDPAQQVTQYAYDAGHNLTQITDPLGNVTKISYSAGQVTSVTRVTNPSAGTGPTTAFTYNSGNTVVTDANGNKTTYYIDSSYHVTKTVDPLGNSPTATYTPGSNLYQYKDAGGATSTLNWDSSNKLTSTVAPTGSQTTLSYSDTAHPYYPTSAVDEQGNTLTYTYDANGNRTSITDGLTTQNKFTFAYNANGTRASMTDALGNITTYGYDSYGNQTSVSYPAPLGAESKTYDGLSRATKEIDGKGQSTTYGYDALDRLTSLTYADGSTITYTYDADGNQSSMVETTGTTSKTTSYTYDALNQMTKKTLPDGTSMNFGYDAVGNLMSLTDAGGTVSYAYNAVNLLTTLTEPNGLKTTFTYDPDYGRLSTVYPNGVTISVTYDSSRRLQSIVAKNSGGTTLTSFTYSYTNPATSRDASLRYSLTDTSSNKTTYTYDALNRLTEAKTINSSGAQIADYQYAYDGNGNRSSQTVNGSTTTYGYNGANQLSGTGYSYDANGNETARQGGMTFSYNAKDQTSTITPPSSSAINMTYTGKGQAQRVGAGSSTYTYNLLGLGTEGSTTYTRDNAGILTDERTAAGSYYYLFDGLGSVVGLTDSNANVSATYSYDPYGQLVNSTGSITNPWRFAGAYFDSATGLYKMGERYYDPSLGRWTQEDSLDSTNLYTYVDDDPINKSDPTGQFAVAALAPAALFCFPECFIVAGAVVAAGVVAYGAYKGTEWVIHQAHRKGKSKRSRDRHQEGTRQEARKTWEKKRQHDDWQDFNAPRKRFGGPR